MSVGAVFDATTVHVNDVVPLSVPSLARNVTPYVPAVVSVPVTRPLAGSIVSPGGRAVEEYTSVLSSGSDATTCSDTAAPTGLDSFDNGVTTGTRSTDCTVHVNV